MDAIVTSELVDGVVAGAVVTGVAAIAYTLVRPREVMPIGGVLFTVAGLIALASWRAVPVALLIGCAGCAGMTAVLARVRYPLWCTVVAVSPFAWLIAEHGGLPRVGWLRAVVVAVVCVAGPLAGAGDDASRPLAIGPALLAVSVAGAYLCTPDTEELRTLLGVAIVVAVLGWPLRWIALGRAGSVAAVAVLAWATAIDARGRPTTALGALACFCVLSITPFVARSLRFEPANLRAPVVLALHVVLVAIAVFAARTLTDTHRAHKAPKGVVVRNHALDSVVPRASGGRPT